MTDDQASRDATRNEITGGTFYAPVTLARDVTMHVTGPAPQAQAGLPAAPAGFVGRTDALEEVLAFLNPAGEGGPGVLVSAVAGMAGIGKTALALMAAHRAMEQGWFDGGVFFIDMRGYTPDPTERVSAAAAAGQLLRAMGIRDTDLPPTGEEQLGLYRSVLTDRARQELPVLVVADNAATTGQVEPLLPAQPCHRLLVTSRHTLTHLPAHLVDLAVLPEADAVDLLRRALQTGRADPRVNAEPEPAAEIARLCGRLPLALQIIGALLRAEPDRPLREMAAELADAQQRLDALDSGDRDQHGRPLAVRAAFDLSYQHLLADQPEQARLFRLLPLNPGPDISLKAAAILTGTPEPVVRRRLAALARAHLLTTPAPGRWGMHDLVRLYADQHGHSQSVDDQRERALDWLLGFYLHTADAADDHLRALPGQAVPDCFTGRDDAMVWFDAERVNLVAAVALAQATGRHHLAHHLPARLNIYLSWRRALDDRLAIDTIAVTSSIQLGDRHGEGQALNNLGVALQEMRRFEEAITAHRDAGAIYRELGDRHGEGMALNSLGNALQGVRRFEEAVTAHEQDLQICRELGDRHREGQALNNLGNALQGVRRFEKAITAYQDATAIFGELGDRHDEGQALNNLGNALQGVRRFEEAVTAHRDAGAIYRELGDRHGEGMALNNLGVALKEMRRFEEAVTAHEQDLQICRELGDRHREGQALGNLGVALQGVRRFEEAIAAYQDATAIFGELGDRHDEGQALDNLGTALQGARRFEEAVTAHRDAGAIYRELGDRHGEGMALNNLGVALKEMRRFEEAVTAHEQDLQICRELGDRHREGQALNNLGVALQGVRRFEEAIAAYQDATAIFGELGDRHDEGQALDNLGTALQGARRFEEAVTAHRDAGAIYRELGDRHGEGMALNNLGIALKEMRRFEEAITAFKRAISIFDSAKDHHSGAIAQANLTRIERQQADRGDAVSRLIQRVTRRIRHG
ncbi:tetratricopeptide repeat protein [Nonomuraea bangladeshensis]|uniref:tetratricopeptide repeat protein n=1 Tax=Nonomuraea bangladeshensis TaxID=404385 RepID=UPI003C301435